MLRALSDGRPLRPLHRVQGYASRVRGHPVTTFRGTQASRAAHATWHSRCKYCSLESGVPIQLFRLDFRLELPLQVGPVRCDHNLGFLERSHAGTLEPSRALEN